MSTVPEMPDQASNSMWSNMIGEVMRALSKCGCIAILGAIVCVGLRSPVLAGTPTLQLPSDSEIHHLLSTRVGVQRQGSGAVVELVTPHGRRTITDGTVAKEQKRPVDGSTVFGVASITKVFTALLLSDMVRRHEIALDDRRIPTISTTATQPICTPFFVDL
jgi:hypothetical protein